ncbi:LicD family-domain-containing protein [Globomyces pollinis-pini]|nr:LicD family-domain-containing protein [Globomyces pollinis-pini]
MKKLKRCGCLTVIHLFLGIILFLCWDSTQNDALINELPFNKETLIAHQSRINLTLEDDLIYNSKSIPKNMKTSDEQWKVEISSSRLHVRTKFTPRFKYQKELDRIHEGDGPLIFYPKTSPFKSKDLIYRNITKNSSLKYFNESKTFAHCDARYCQPEVKNPNYRLVKLQEILGGWENFTMTHNIKSWMSHGTLLGWFWNYQLLPWDFDIDFQMTITDLIRLNQFNQTVYLDRFLIDANPNYNHRYHQSDNVIDLRFIDIQSGLYIDVTGLSATPDKLDTVSCKSPHYYSEQDIMPLHQTVFEGFMFYRPHNVLMILKEEYGEKSMIIEAFKGYRWNRVKLEWYKYSAGNTHLPNYGYIPKQPIRRFR